LSKHVPANLPPPTFHLKGGMLAPKGTPSEEPMGLKSIATIISTFFYTFLDITGILLGIFLMALGWWITTGHTVSIWVGVVVLALGVCAFVIHTGHYFHLGLTSWIFGTTTYFHKDQK
jgi:hypothetical protein